MADSTTKARRVMRPIGIVATGTVMYFLTLLMVLYVLDRQVYTSKKLEIIRYNYYRIFDLPDINTTANAALFGTTPAERVAALASLQKTLGGIVTGPSSMFRMELRDATDVIVAQADNSAKVNRFNTWHNSLFLRDFTGRISQGVSDPQSSQRGLLIGYYTSPSNYPPIEQLTSRFRWLAFLIVALWAAVYAFLYQNLLRPVRNVTRHLERSRETPPRLILKARAHLESAYNQLATRALLHLIEEKLSAPTRPDVEGQAEDRAAAVAEALRIAAEAFGVGRIAAAEIAISDEQSAVTESFSPVAQTEPVKDAELLTQIKPFLSSQKLQSVEEDGQFEHNSSGAGFTYFAPLSTGSFLLITGMLDQELPGMKNRAEGLRRACIVIRRGFLAYKAYRQGIFRQRSEANIVLSRNLGHDLTNIIATSKLDLMAVRRLLDAPSQEPDTARGELLRQAIHGLLENTRFLQEIVNIYRSFSNVKRPQFERRDLKSVIEEFLAAFEPAVSARVSIRRELDTQMPAPIIEPRLLKLALFNVLTNALDALRRASAVENPQAVVIVRTRFDSAAQLYRIDVEDNGPGIRDSENRLLAPAELQAIFEYGYSTKSESSEGLGLSWVHTIMTDFHDGGVVAENLPEGGARFTLLLRSMERSEAKVG
ncbi:MAG: ATP-binding protein [Candidatus Sumerlaeaceae bacterium]